MCFGKEYLTCSLIEYLVYFCAGDICIWGVQEGVGEWIVLVAVWWGLLAQCLLSCDTLRHMMFCYITVKFQNVKKSTISSRIVVTCTLRARYRLVDILPRAISTSLSASLSTSLSVVWTATPIWLVCNHNIIALLRQHHCPATATSFSCYGNIILLLFKALSWLFSVLVVKLIEPIKVKKWVSIVRLCEIFERL